MKRDSRFTTVAGVAWLAACGGGGAVLAALPFVAPIGGFWQSIDPSDPTATLSFSPPGGQNNLYGGTNASYPVTLSSHSTACGAADTDLSLVAKFDGTNFTLSQSQATAPCLSGSFVDEITIVLATGGNGIRLRNQLALQPQFEQGVWFNLDRSTQRLKFRNAAVANGSVITQTGCEFDASTQTGTVVIQYRNGDAAAGTLPAIDSIIITRAAGTETWTNGSMYGASALRISGPGGATVSLERSNDALAC